MTGIIILAAGASTRMGQPKQQLKFGDETLLQRAVRTALDTMAASVIVVLGANAHEIQAELQQGSAVISVNPDWQEGMASSIRIGLQQLQKQLPEVENAIFMLCDQPFVSSALLNQLIQTHNEDKGGIIACTYNDTIGAPVLFNKRYFGELMALSGQEGAKHLLLKFSDDVIAVPFDQGGIDIDTPEDYQRLTDKS
jgi:molybdenum cofactor cytidylyltransferase